MSVALILGIGGQDGSYLADILLERGCAVHGLYRHSSVNNLTRIEHIRDRVTLHQGDITDPSSVLRVLQTVGPDEVYNEADQDHVGYSLDTPGVSFDVTARATATTLEMVRLVDKSIRFFQPCSATMFGDAPSPQDENTPHNPQSPYACAKTAAYHLARYYRQAYGMFVSTAIMYNHDSPRRDGEYLLHQICRQALNGSEIVVGDPGMVVDIGYARDYMAGAVDILQQKKPDDFILASGLCYTIHAIAGRVTTILRQSSYTVRADKTLLRPGKQPTLVGDIGKAYRAFRFSPDCSMNNLLSMILEKVKCE